MGLHQTKSFCSAKEIINKVKRQPSEWENIFANKAFAKGLKSKIYKELIQLNNNKKQKIWLKNGQRTWTDISPKKTYKCPKDMKRCSTSLASREMQIKTTMRYHLIPVRIAIINRTSNNKCWRGYGKKKTPIHCW